MKTEKRNLLDAIYTFNAPIFQTRPFQHSTHCQVEKEHNVFPNQVQSDGTFGQSNVLCTGIQSVRLLNLLNWHRILFYIRLL